MNRFILLARSLRYFAPTHTGTVLGAAVGAAVLIGALVVGDSVRGSLRDMALARIGKIDFAMASQDRLFRAALADAFTADQPLANAAAVLQLPATAATASGSARANQVQLSGVGTAFWNLALKKPDFARLPENSVVLNQALQAQLGVQIGETLVFRVQKPTHLSRDAPLAPEEDTTLALRLTVHAIASDTAFGRFSLQASQVAPFNAFVDLEYLQSKLETGPRANLLLVHAPSDWTVTNAVDRLARHWTLADAQLEWLKLGDAATRNGAQPEAARGADQGLELRSPRVFLDPPVSRAALGAATGAAGVLTYFVNTIRAGDRLTPYSMVTAATPPWTPTDLGDDEIIVNQWLADDLKVSAGAAVTLTYFVVGIGRELREESRDFRVRTVVGMEDPRFDKQLMPDFPGLSDADNCRDWDTGFPIELDRIRDRDEAYWDTYRGTPKAMVSLNAGREMWRNRFGDLTSVRFPAGTDEEAAASRILGTVTPAEVGLQFQAVRERALASVNQSQDFGGLFLGFSFFLVTAALLLMALLFQFTVENRATETGILLALGLPPKFVRRQLLMEGAVLGTTGAILGLIGGVGYAAAMLRGLATIWRDAVGTTSLSLHVHPITLVYGTAAASVVAWSILWFGLRRQTRQPARTLLAGGAEAGFEVERIETTGSRSRWIAAGSGGTAVALVVWAAASGAHQSAGAFFGAGTLLLISGLAFASVFLGRLGVGADGAPRWNTLAVRNASRRRTRSLATIGLLACGSFLVVAVGANKLDAVRNAEARESGTGGFAFWTESALPVVQDLNGASGRDFFGLDRPEFNEVRFVPFRLREGEDASCLNLNRAQQPRVLGVNPDLLAERGAFTFTKTIDTESSENAWRLLASPTSDGAVPAIADHNSILWAMGKKIGDTLAYVDEQGRPYEVQLVGAVANSILQGNLIIAETEFIRRYPSTSGYRIFLMDAPAGQRDVLSKSLSRAMRDVGLEITPAVRRLDAFNDVQNTYLSTFQLLGGLGLILGSVGLGIVVLRNVSERRGELALLNAVGFRPVVLRRLIVWEHAALLIFGLVVGVVSALLAVLPALASPGAELPTISLSLTLLAVLASGLIWTWIAALFALKGRLLEALRNS